LGLTVSFVWLQEDESQESRITIQIDQEIIDRIAAAEADRFSQDGTFQKNLSSQLVSFFGHFHSQFSGALMPNAFATCTLQVLQFRCSCGTAMRG
jgi:hypothetical protein